MATRAERIVVVGASAFGPTLVRRLLQGLAHAEATAVIVVQHGFDRAEMQNTYGTKDLPFPLVFPADGEGVEAGSVYAAARGLHLGFDRHRTGLRCRLFDLGPLFSFCPAIDVAMATAARAHGASAVGVLVAGASFGRDGTLGGLAMREAGCRVYGAEEGAAREGLVREAFEAGGIDALLPIDEITRRILAEDPRGKKSAARPASSDDVDERRRQVRLALPFVVEIWDRDGGTESWRETGTAADVSAGGLLIRRTAPERRNPYEEMRVTVRLSPPGSPARFLWLEEHGTVVRTTGGPFVEGIIAVRFEREIRFGDLVRPA